MKTGVKGSSFSSTLWLSQLLADSCKSMCMDFYRKSSQIETTFLEVDESKNKVKEKEKEFEKRRHFYEIEEQISKENHGDKDNSNSGREFWKLLNSCNSSQISMMNQINEEPIDFDFGSTSSRASPQQQQQQQQQSTHDEDARQYDLVIFAASGTVGRFLVEEMSLVIDKHYSSNSSSSSTAATTTQHTNIATSTLNLKELRDPLQFAQQSNSYLSGNNNNNNNCTAAGVRRVSVPRYVDGIKWAIAGRSAIRLSDTLCRAEISTGVRDLSTQVPVILADLDHHRSLLEMCSKTNVVINCAGPYTLDGEALIKACLETRTNYIDLSHESSYIERIRVNYHAMALRNNVFIMNGCGFQSMSAEMGLNFIKQIVDGQIDEVKIMLNLNETKALVRPARNGGCRAQPYDRSHCGIISLGMWNSFLVEKSQLDHKRANHQILGTSSSNEQNSSSNKETANNEQKDKQRYLLRKDTQTLVRDLVEYKNKKASGWLQLMRGFNEGGRKYCLPVNNFMSDELQLTRGEMTNYEIREPDSSGDGWRPIICTSYLSLSSLYEVLALFFWMLLFNILVQIPLFKTLMRLVPSMVTFGQVTNSSSSKYIDRDSLSRIKFCQTLIAYGTPGDNSGDPLETRERHVKRKQEQLIVARVVGPEPNHVATATFAIQAALTIILEKDHLPSSGGVLTPGAAFSETNIIHQLRRRNIKFEVLKKA